MKLDNLKIKYKTSKKDFGRFLLKLSNSSQDTFNHFGKIDKYTVKKIIKKEFTRKDKIKFFTYYCDELIGYSFLTKFEKLTKKHNCILGIIILDSFQNKGFGKKICKHMINTAWKRGLTKIWLNVFYDNVRAFNLYKYLGFQIEGIFIDDEITNGKKRHVVSMALLKNKNYDFSFRIKLRNKIDKKRIQL